MNSAGVHANPASSRPAERFDRGLWASVLLHVVLGVLLVTSPALFPAFGDSPWGSDGGLGGGISVNLVAAPGIPLPAPPITRPDAVGNDSAGLYTPPAEATPSAPEEVPADAELIPETFPEVVSDEPPAEPEPEPAEVAAANPAPAEETSPAPDNAVPFGEGGQPDIGGGVSSDQGIGGMAVGDGTFGERYGRYVDAMRRRISESWFQSMVDANVRSGLRVTMGFEVLRNGTLRNVRIVAPSGVRSLDESAERALLRVRRLEPLPPTYRGASIDVEFWFEFRR
jgi:TonB family protein